VNSGACEGPSRFPVTPSREASVIVSGRGAAESRHPGSMPQPAIPTSQWSDRETTAGETVSNMNQHDRYGKHVLRSIAGSALVVRGEALRVRYQGGINASIDGIVAGCCAVEIESRVAKQVRGALIDLLFHSCPKKLLILVPAHMNNPTAVARHCEWLLNTLREPHHWVQVTLLEGTGDAPCYEEDRRRVLRSLRELGVTDLDVAE